MPKEAAGYKPQRASSSRPFRVMNPSLSMVEQHREDGAIAPPLERLGPRRIEEGARLSVAHTHHEITAGKPDRG